MRSGVPTVVIFSGMLLAPALARGQEPVRSFNALNTRLRPGDRVWVTDAQGREVEGKVQVLLPDLLTLQNSTVTTLAARDVKFVRERVRDSLKDGTLKGLAVGGGFMALACVAGDVGAECWLFVAVEAGFGAAIGAGVDAMIRGKKLVVYRAPASGNEAQPRVSIGPFMKPRARVAAVSISF